MEVIYNVKQSFKGNSEINEEKMKELFNKKWLNIIVILEKQNNWSLNKS